MLAVQLNSHCNRNSTFYNNPTISLMIISFQIISFGLHFHLLVGQPGKRFPCFTFQILCSNFGQSIRHLKCRSCIIKFRPNFKAEKISIYFLQVKDRRRDWKWFDFTKFSV